MTREEAPDAIWTHNQPKLDKIKITLIHGDKTREFDYKDINAQINIEEVVTRPSWLADRHHRRQVQGDL